MSDSVLNGPDRVEGWAVKSVPSQVQVLATPEPRFP
jgi:hypothetical protein